MATASTHAQSPSAQRPVTQHGVVVFDREGAMVHANDFARTVLGLRGESRYEEFVSRIRPDGEGRGVPGPGREASVRVRTVERDTPLELSSHVVRLPARAGADGPDAEATVYVLVPAGDRAADPAIHRGIAAVLSHELRTPITTIYAGSQMLRTRSRLSEESQREMLADIQGEAERLYRLVEDVLVANRGRSGIEVAHEPLLLQRVLPRLVAMEAARWPDVEFATTIASQLPAVRGDEIYLEQVLRDLLANAGSFTPPGGTVRIDGRWTGSGVDVRVLDEGPGIEPSDEPYLFRPFGRLAAHASGRPGPGLGLYVCKLLVEAMGGRIWGHRRPSGGSEFGFTLVPYADES